MTHHKDVNRAVATRADTVLRLDSVSKSFGGAHALSEVSFDLAAGEIHALVGMNGAGKSTLVGVLSGVHAPDSGTIDIDGTEHSSLSPRRARDAGISTVPQRRKLVGDLTVAENLFLGQLPTRAGLIDWKRAMSRATEVLAEIGADDIDPRLRASALSIAEQTKIEIAREVQRGGRILILDEPTASLSGAEALDVQDLVRGLRSRGTAIIYISHHLDEIIDLADRVTVLRDGKDRLTTTSAELTVPDLVYAMAGEHIETERPARTGEAGEERLSVSGLTVGGRLEDFSVDVRAGEVVAVLGPAGHGQSSLFPVLSGSQKPDSGQLRVQGRHVPWGRISASLGSGLRCITGDRLRNGLVAGLSVDENIVMFRQRFERRHWINWTTITERARGLRERFRITTLQKNPPVGQLSGGNQQKVLLAKWLDQSPPMVVLEEPTNGVDVTAKPEIYAMIEDLIAEGTGVLLVGSDVDEILRLADRVSVINGDRVIASRAIDDLTRDELIALTVGSTDGTEHNGGAGQNIRTNQTIHTETASRSQGVASDV